MSLLDIHVLGSPVLRQETERVTAVTDELRRLVDDMFETMHAAKGIGLAAPQVGRTERLFVADVDDVRVVMFNPEIVTADGGTAKAEEGCLSIPEIYGDVTRSARVTVEALGRDGTPWRMDAEGLLAVCLQHEIDHLHGKLFIDYLSLLKRRSALAKWEKMKAQFPDFTRRLSAKEAARHANEETL